MFYIIGYCLLAFAFVTSFFGGMLTIIEEKPRYLPFFFLFYVIILFIVKYMF